MAAQAGLCLAWSETPEDTFCRVVAQIYINLPIKAPVGILSLSTIQTLVVE